MKAQEDEEESSEEVLAIATTSDPLVEAADTSSLSSSELSDVLCYYGEVS